MAVDFMAAGGFQHFKKNSLLLFTVSGSQEPIEDRQVGPLFEQESGCMGILGSGVRKGQMSRVLVQTGQHQGGLDGSQRHIFGPQAPDHQGYVGTHRMMAFPNRFNTERLVVVIP